VGIVVVSTTIGVRWSSVQWLVAAVTVGLGFGLQEIFANFVSGLILLFERPIRVGDIVTVDNVDGVVSKIQMRATTITNWDRKEYVVPNKEFITGRLLNWTLSNQINRIAINLGLAHGSDIQLAHRLLTKIVEEHPAIMKDPGPMVTFEGFGESTLNFVIRCYLPNMDNRLSTIHELHMTIDQEFRAAGIRIAFPQRDIHIRSVEDVFPLARARTPSTNGSAGDPSQPKNHGG
jgi:potassium efflux system protein